MSGLEHAITPHTYFMQNPQNVNITKEGHHGKRMKDQKAESRTSAINSKSYSHLKRFRRKLIFAGKFFRIFSVILRITEKFSAELSLRVRQASS
jgi:hypothetical protein